MVDKELCDFIAKVEAAYSRRLLKSWERDLESFPENEAAERGNRLESEDVSYPSALISSISRSQDDRRGGNLSAGRGGECTPADVVG